MNILDRVATQRLARRSLPEAERQLDELVKSLKELECVRHESPQVASLFIRRRRLVRELSFHVHKLRKLSNLPTPTAAIKAPPGWGLRGLAELIFSPNTFQAVFEPICRDLYDEHCEALKEGKIWKARAALVRNYWAFWSAVAAQAPISVFKVIYKIWKAIP